MKQNSQSSKSSSDVSDDLKLEENYHRPVMLIECMEGLNIQPNGIYVDATFGGGGHSREILKYLTTGQLIGFDQDAEAIKQAELIQQRSFTGCQANFQYLKKYLKLHGITKVNGILADLGVSSHQIDSPHRGFSTRFDGPLDMRMNIESTKSAAQLIAEYSEVELVRILSQYGELKNARTAANQLVVARNKKAITSTAELKEALKNVAPRGKENRYFAQVFQALRIEVNEELTALENFLHQCGEMIDTNGRLVVMSYHSLEDRLVKNYIRSGNVHDQLEKDFFGNKLVPFHAVNRKPMMASEDEIERNNRARSAKLRIAKRL